MSLEILSCLVGLRDFNTIVKYLFLVGLRLYNLSGDSNIIVKYLLLVGLRLYN